MTRRIGVLVNPTSGRGRAGRVAPDILRGLASRGDRIVSIQGVDAEDAAERLAEAMGEGLDVVVAVGGDGTVHLALQAVGGTDTALGIVPLGTGNDAARELGVPRGSTSEAVAAILAGRTRTFDTGVVETADGQVRRFLCVLSTGFDAHVTQRANEMSRPSGNARYVLAMLAELRAFSPITYQMEVDGQVSTSDAMFISVGNGRSYGGGMMVCPNADTHDGLMTMVWIDEISRPELLRTFPKVYSGSHMDHPKVSERTGRVIRLSAVDQVAFADGEHVGPLPITIRSEADSVAVIVPR